MRKARGGWSGENIPRLFTISVLLCFLTIISHQYVLAAPASLHPVAPETPTSTDSNSAIDPTPNSVPAALELARIFSKKNRTAELERWRAGPKTRGTFNILFSCTLTIALAVWSAMIVNIQMAASETIKIARPRKGKKFRPHPNPAVKLVHVVEGHGMENSSPSKVPFEWVRDCWARFVLQGKRIRRRLAARWSYKILWAILTALVPEALLIIAMAELDAARMLLRNLKLLDNAGGRKKQARVFKRWNMKMAYYAVMGGFYLEIIDDPKDSKAKPKVEGASKFPSSHENQREAESEIGITTHTVDSSDLNPKDCEIIILEKDPEIPEPNEKLKPPARMHRPDTLGRRICSVNCTRIAFHSEKYARKKEWTHQDREKRRQWKRKNPGKKNSENPQKPREVLTLHGLFYIANLCIYHQERTLEDKCISEEDSDVETEMIDKTHLGPPSNKIERKGFWNWMVNLTAGAPPCKKWHNNAFWEHIPRKNRIPREDAMRIRRQLNDMNPAILDDISKGDVVAKALLVMQGVWMIIQVTARRVNGLPIVLLELNAAAHIAIALLQYLVWWYKPIDVMVMTPITLTRKQYEDMINTDTWEVTNSLQIHRMHRDFLRGKEDGEIRTKVSIDDRRGVDRRQGTTSTAPSTGCYWDKLLYLDEEEDKNNRYLTSQSTLAKEIYRNCTRPVKIHQDYLRAAVAAILHYSFTWHKYTFLTLAWFVAAFAYGAIHVSAWRWLFPSELERVAWNVCTAYTVGSLTMLMVLAAMISIYTAMMKSALRNKDKHRIMYCFVMGMAPVVRFMLKLCGLLCSAGIIPWVLARLFMFLESYLAMRRVEKGSYDTLDWIEILPHMG